MTAFETACVSGHCEESAAADAEGGVATKQSRGILGRELWYAGVFQQAPPFMADGLPRVFRDPDHANVLDGIHGTYARPGRAQGHPAHALAEAA